MRKEIEYTRDSESVLLRNNVKPSYNKRKTEVHGIKII